MLLSDIHSFFGRTLSHSFHFIYFLYNILTPSNPLFMPWLLIYEKKFPEVKAYDLLNHFLLEVISAYLSPCPISNPDDLVFFFNGMSWIHSSCSFMSFLERDFYPSWRSARRSMPQSTAPVITPLSLLSCRPGNIQLIWNAILSRGLHWL